MWQCTETWAIICQPFWRAVNQSSNRAKQLSSPSPSLKVLYTHFTLPESRVRGNALSFICLGSHWRATSDGNLSIISSHSQVPYVLRSIPHLQLTWLVTLDPPTATATSLASLRNSIGCPSGIHKRHLNQDSLVEELSQKKIKKKKNTSAIF